MRQLPYPAVRTLLGNGHGFAPHEHAVHQLVWAGEGELRIQTGGSFWVVAKGAALWLPAGVAHEVLAERDATMQSLYFAPDRCPLDWPRPTLVRRHGMLGQVLEHLFELPLGPRRARAEAFAFDLMQPAPGHPIDAPMPVDDRARHVALTLWSDPTDPRTLTEWGRSVGASGRTLARVIERETGMGFTEWRTRVRIAQAAQRLAAGEQVARVALDVGYATSSAFVAAFRRVVGVTPRCYATARRSDDDPSGVVHFVTSGARTDLDHGGVRR